MSRKIPVRPEVEPLVAYPPGLPEEEVKRRFGVERVVKLASNENPLGPSPRALEALTREATLRSLGRYPELVTLKAALADHMGVETDRIILGNGSDEITLLLALTFLRPGDNIVTSKPEFIRYKMAAELVGAGTREVPLKDWRHDVDGIIEAIGPATRAVFVASPTNPVGTMLTAEEIERLADAVPEETLFVLDQAYHEYAASDPDYPVTERLFERYPNLLVTRTFSKAYGLAGLRVGYGIARPEIVEAIERVRPPFNINRIAAAAAKAALGDLEHLRKTTELNEHGVQQLSDAFSGLELECVPTKANFLLVDMGRDAREIFEKLLRRGVIVRPMAGYGLPCHLRISIGTKEENEILIQELAPLII